MTKIRYHHVPDMDIDMPILEELDRLSTELGSQSKAAKKLGYSQSHINNILLGKNAIPDELAKALGFKRNWVKTQ